MGENHTIGVIAVIVSIAFFFHIHTLNQKITARENMIEDCSSQIDDANSSIDDANSAIEDAQGNAWSNYDDMGDALDNLQTVDNVTNDCYVPLEN